MSAGISEHYRELTAAEVDAFYSARELSWQDPSMPRRQYERVVAGELAKFRAGESVLPYTVALEALRMLPAMNNPTLLDVGASSGYYSEVQKIGGFDCQYTGVDYSPHFQRLAGELYPGIHFDVGDACHLPYPHGAFEIVLHSAVLMHVRDYEKAIAEAARVAKSYVIFHRTPVEEKRWTRFFAKECYGIPAMEIHFAPSELLRLFDAYGLSLIDSIDLFLGADGFGHRTYILKKDALFHHAV